MNPKFEIGTRVKVSDSCNCFFKCEGCDNGYEGDILEIVEHPEENSYLIQFEQESWWHEEICLSPAGAG